MNIEQIWKEYQGRLKGYLHLRVSNPADVDDLLQEILIKTHQNLHKVKTETNVKAWLFQITRNSLIDFYRKNSKLNETQVDELFFVTEESDSNPSDLEDCIEPFINALPEEQAKLLKLVDINGNDQKDLAKTLGINYSTLKSRVQKSRAELKKLFEGCCKFELDNRGNIIDYTQKTSSKQKKCTKC